MTDQTDQRAREMCGSDVLAGDCLRIAILRLPAVRQEIEVRARKIYLAALSPHGRALEHWLKAEEEALAWIDAALACTSVSPRDAALLTP